MPCEQVPAYRPDQGRKHQRLAVCDNIGVDNARSERVGDLVPKNAPIRLRVAAMMTAVRGLSTLVETTVAMALAQS